ncbi:MAG: ATP-binding protein [Alphaproteobacteria bacterium]
MVKKVGHIVAISGSHLSAVLSSDSDIPMTTGLFVILESGTKAHLGIIIKIESIENIEKNEKSHILATILTKGEIFYTPSGKISFKKGTSSPVIMGADVVLATDDDLLSIFADTDEPYITLGTISKTNNVPAKVLINRFLGANFGIFGNRGGGKSTTVCLLIHKLLDTMPYAHCLLFDPHGEYEAAFNGKAHVINQDNFVLPFWLLNSEEINRIFLDPQSPTLNAEEEVLSEIVTQARQRYAVQLEKETARITVDSPVPYRMSDLIEILDERLGSLGESVKVSILRRMRQRILSVRGDVRYKFLFPKMGANQDLHHIITDLLRIPVSGKPVTLINTSGMITDIAQVVVSTITRLVFDFLQWTRDMHMPVLMIMDEAQRYLGDDKSRFSKTTQRLWEQIAMEGRKFGISLGIVTQIPSGLPSSILSQLGTVLVKKMNSDAEIALLARYVGDMPTEIGESFSSFSRDQLYIAGDGVRNPMTVKCDSLSEERRPRSKGGDFLDSWSKESNPHDHVYAGLAAWCDYKPE